MSNINRISNNPNVDTSKQAGGLCKTTLRNTPHVSDKAYGNCQIRLLSEISVTIRIFAETEKNLIGVLNQSAENAGVAFVKGADERNEFFVKINKQ